MHNKHIDKKKEKKRKNHNLSFSAIDCCVCQQLTCDWKYVINLSCILLVHRTASKWEYNTCKKSLSGFIFTYITPLVVVPSLSNIRSLDRDINAISELTDWVAHASPKPQEYNKHFNDDTQYGLPFSQSSLVLIK